MTTTTQTAEAISLDPDLTVRTAAGLRDQLLKSLSVTPPVVLDGARVERIDAGGLQLLAAFCREHAAAGNAVSWQSPSTALIEAVRVAGLAETLALAGPTG